jgi:hypothetical protein
MTRGTVLSLMAGPSLTGLLLTGLVSGRAGLRDLRARLLRWRGGARWYAVALLTADPAPRVGLVVNQSPNTDPSDGRVPRPPVSGETLAGGESRKKLLSAV